MLNFFHVVRNTFRESLREPIFFLLLCTALALIGIFPSLSLFVFREQIKLVIDSSMATTMVFGLLAAVLCVSHTVSREMRNGTVLLLLSKPVPRWHFILAKIVGITLALSVFVFICNIASLISLRIAKDQFSLDFLTLYTYYGVMFLASFIGAVKNYYAGKCFPSASIGAMCFLFPVYTVIMYFVPVEGELVSPRYEVLPALLLIFFAVWVMGAITVTLGTRFNTVVNLTVCTAFFLLGLVSDYFFGRYPGSDMFFSIIYALLPNWQFFWMADALANKRNIPLEYILWAGVYVLFYMSLCSMIAIALFKDKEITESTTF